MELPQTGKTFPQEKLVPVVVPEDPDHAESGLPERYRREGGHEVTGMEDQLDAPFLKNPQRRPELVQVIVGVGDYPYDHGPEFSFRHGITSRRAFTSPI